MPVEVEVVWPTVTGVSGMPSVALAAGLAAGQIGNQIPEAVARFVRHDGRDAVGIANGGMRRRKS